MAGEPLEPLKLKPSLGSLSDGLASRSGGCHSSHTHKTALAHRTGFRCAVNGGGNRDRWDRPGIRLRFHNHAPEQASISLAFHQPAANQLRGNDLRWTAEEGVGQGWEILGDGRGG